MKEIFHSHGYGCVLADVFMTSIVVAEGLEDLAKFMKDPWSKDNQELVDIYNMPEFTTNELEYIVVNMNGMNRTEAYAYLTFVDTSRYIIPSYKWKKIRVFVYDDKADLVRGYLKTVLPEKITDDSIDQFIPYLDYQKILLTSPYFLAEAPNGLKFAYDRR